MNLIEGFDYRMQRARHLSRREWSQDLQMVVRDGGRRRVTSGETFAYDEGGRLLFEIHAVVNVRHSP